MLSKFNSLQSRLLIVLFLLLGSIQASNAAQSCEYQVFNIKTAENIQTLDLLSQIADSCDFSIIVKDDIARDLLDKELFGINIKELSLDEIFEVLLSDNDLYYDYDKNFLKISALDTKTFKVDYITSVRIGTAVLDASFEGATEDGDTDSTSSSTNSVSSSDSFDFWATMATEITAMLNTGSEKYMAQAPIVNSNAGLVTVTGTKKQLDRVEAYIKVLKGRLHKQVLIDVSILSVDLKNTKSTGVNWEEFNLQLKSTAKFNNKSRYADDGSSHTFDSPGVNEGLSFSDYNNLSVVNDALFSMSGLIDFLNTNGDTKVVSNPKILTLNNQQALITIGDTYNYKITTTTNANDSGANVSTEEEVRSIFVGVLLNITPEITETGEIILRINPSVSELKNEAGDANTRTIAPDTREKKLTTVVKVKNNNTIILGGLITNTEGIDSSKVPVLGDIPLLGNAFKHSENTVSTQELIFVITPRIIGPKDNTKATLKDLGFSKRIYEQ